MAITFIHPSPRLWTGALSATVSAASQVNVMYMGLGSNTTNSEPTRVSAVTGQLPSAHSPFFFKQATHGNVQSSANGTAWMEFFGPGQIPCIQLVCTGTVGELRVEMWNGSGWDAIGTSSGIWNQTTFGYNQFMALYVEFHETTGVIKLYRDEDIMVDFTGDTIRSAATSIEYVKYNQTGNYTYYTGCFAADTNMSNTRVGYGRVTGDGAHTAWNGSYTDIRYDLSTANINTANVTGDRESYTVTNSSGFDGFNIVGAGVFAFARPGAGTSAALDFFLRINGTDYDQTGDTTVNLAGWNPYWYTWATNPDTAGAWTRTAMDAAEIGIRRVT